jgi:hypothetical protein
MLCDAAAGNVNVRAGRFLVWPDETDFAHRFFIFRLV